MKRLLAVVVVAASLQILSASPARAATNLTLINGWAATTTPAVSIDDGVVHLRGSISNTTTTSHEPFVLPTTFRPSAMVFVPVDLCDGELGRVLFQPNGVVRIQSEEDFAQALCFTSLDGVSFLKDQAGSTLLALQNGWTNSPNNTRPAAIEQINGVVRFSGAIANGTTLGGPFSLPPAFRPPKDLYLEITLCDGKNGRLVVFDYGGVLIQVQGASSDAQCLTSLEGASFVRNQGVTSLVLENGWVGGASGTRAAGAKVIDGVVHFRGGVEGGSSSRITTLPVEMRPPSPVYLPVGLCGTTHGRLKIGSSGEVDVYAEGGEPASCFTSLDGVSFDLPS